MDDSFSSTIILFRLRFVHAVFCNVSSKSLTPILRNAAFFTTTLIMFHYYTDQCTEKFDATPITLHEKDYFVLILNVNLFRN